MMRIIKYLLTTTLMMAAWTAVIMFGTFEGWFHRPIAEEKSRESFIQAVDREIDNQFVGCFALALMKNGEVEYEHFFTAGEVVDRNTVFQVSSLSKWITAFGVLKLVEEGRLSLDTPVSRYLSRWQLSPSEFDNEQVTVRRLLSHTAGLTDGLGYSGFESRDQVQAIEESLSKALDADASASGSVLVGIEPGTAFKYSGGGYTLLQLLVEEVTGQSFASYMAEAVFEPLGMTHSTYVWNDSSADQLAEFYNVDGSKAKHVYYTSLAATSLYTSLSDMEIFFQVHLPAKNNEPLGRRVVQPTTLRLMRQPHAQQMGVHIWGLGTVLYAPVDDNDFIIGHDGKSTPPINTAVRLNPQTGDGIIILETGNPGLATRLASEWVFWKTGKVDLFLFPILFKQSVMIAVWGCVVIVVGLTLFFF